MNLKRGELDEIPGLGDNLSALIAVPTGDLISLPGHPWVFKDPDIERAKQFVSRYQGRALPILADDDNHILAGAIFVEAARRLGIKLLKVIRQSGISEAEALLFGTAISKIQSLGSWDGAAMEKALRQFEEHIEDFSAALIGFAPGELDRLIGADIFDGAGNSEPPVEERPISWVGATWVCGDHRLLCGDATCPDTVAELLAGETISLAICDPPFGCKVDGFVSRKGRHRDFIQGAGEMAPDALLEFFRRFCRAMASGLKPGALVYLFIDWRSLSLLQQAASEIFGSLVNLCVWAKDRGGQGSFYRSQHELVLVYAMPGARHRNNIELGQHGRNRSNVWCYPSAASLRRGREPDMQGKHPTPKPVELVADAIIDGSLRGEIVFDCFLGSGATLIAAERTARQFRGMDLEPRYVDLAVRRWQDWTGRDAVDAASGRTFNEIAEAGHDEEEG